MRLAGEAEALPFDPLEALAADDMLTSLETEEAELKRELNLDDKLLDRLLRELGPLVDSVELLRLEFVGGIQRNDPPFSAFCAVIRTGIEIARSAIDPTESLLSGSPRISKLVPVCPT